MPNFYHSDGSTATRAVIGNVGSWKRLQAKAAAGELGAGERYLSTAPYGKPYIRYPCCVNAPIRSVFAVESQRQAVVHVHIFTEDADGNCRSRAGGAAPHIHCAAGIH